MCHGDFGVVLSVNTVLKLRLDTVAREKFSYNAKKFSIDFLKENKSLSIQSDFFQDTMAELEVAIHFRSWPFVSSVF